MQLPLSGHFARKMNKDLQDLQTAPPSTKLVLAFPAPETSSDELAQSQSCHGDSLTDWNFLQVISSQVESPEGGQVADLDRQVRDLVAGGVQFHQGCHPPDFLGQRH